MPRVSQPEDVPQSGKNLPSNGKTILIAEDDPFIARMYETKLTMGGYQVILKSNGREAYDALRESTPDLVLIDINMPELTGFEVLQALKAEGVKLDPDKVIILTNSSGTENQDKAKEFGVDFIIKADLTPKAVLDKINQKLGIKG
jgi:CheY-like chemotaxis protein